jgi:PAT family beta-lactamase induction signal transducer AmpG
MLLLGFGCGLPFILAGSTLGIWLRRSGYDLAVIGYLSWATLFYTLKFLWAPWLDRHPSPWLARMGLRRGWLLSAQLAVAAALLLVAWLGPEAGPVALAFAVAMLTFAGATQDVVVDAYRIESAPLEAQGALAAAYTLGYRLALLSGGAGALYVAAAAGWPQAYGTMAALMALPVAATLLAREPERPAASGRGPRAYLQPFSAFVSERGLALVAVLIAFIGLYKLPDQVLGVVAGPFYVDMGFSDREIATVSKVYGVWIGIAGAFLGGLALPLLGLRLALVLAALAIAISNLLFLVMAAHPGALWAFVLAISGDNLAQGFGGTVLVAFLSALVDRRYSATHYALLSALANLPGKLVGGLSGQIVEATSFGLFFAASSLAAVPAILLLLWLWPRVFRSAQAG